jgi:atypical dual specificity phosphatase
VDAENAELRASVAQLRHMLGVVGRVVAIPAVARAVASLSDEQLLAAGLSPTDLAALRTMSTPLPNFSWLLPDLLAGCGRPRGPEAVAYLAQSGVRRLVTLTEDPLPPEWLVAAGVEGLHVPVADFGAPTAAQLADAVDALQASIEAGEPAAVHCAAGMGRTGTVLAALLVRRGATPDDAIAEVRRLRPGSIETPAQVAAVRDYAASLP